MVKLLAHQIIQLIQIQIGMILNQAGLTQVQKQTLILKNLAAVILTQKNLVQPILRNQGQTTQVQQIPKNLDKHQEDLIQTSTIQDKIQGQTTQALKILDKHLTLQMFRQLSKI